jgi:cell division protein FtsQ
MSRVKPRPQPAPLPDRPGRWKLLFRRRRKLLHPMLFASLVALMLVAGSGILRLAPQNGSIRERLGAATVELGFDTREIIVQGRGKTPQAALEAALAVRQGDPILTVSLAQARARIETIPWVRSAVVERVLPHTIRIVLDERSPFAVWQNKGNFTLIDQAGHIVSDADISAFVNVLPLVVGEGASVDAARLLAAYAKYPPLSGRMLAAIRVGQRRWDLCMSSGAIVQLPEGAEDQALSRLADLQTSKALLDRPLQEIDMRLPDRLHVRPMTEPPCGHADPTSGANAADPDPRKPA